MHQEEACSYDFSYYSIHLTSVNCHLLLSYKDLKTQTDTKVYENRAHFKLSLFFCFDSGFDLLVIARNEAIP